MKKIALYLVCLFLFAAMVTACGNANNTAGEEETAVPTSVNRQNPEDTQASEKPHKPVTLNFVNMIGMGAEDFNVNVKAPIEQLYPHVTMEFLNPGKGFSIPDMIVSGIKPDLIYGALGQVSQMVKLDLAQDMTPLLKQYNLDTSRFTDEILDNMRKFSGGNLYGIPVSLKQMVLYYNKDIFERFNVDYPSDNMTWDQIYQLARKLNQTENEVKYIGFDMNLPIGILYNQLSLPFVDPVTHKAVIHSDGWKRWVETISQMYSIPGNELDPKTMGDDQRQLFLKDKRLAMTVSNSFYGMLQQVVDNDGFRFGIVTQPVFDDLAGVANQMSSPYMAIASSSEHPEEAMNVIKFLLSDEEQLKRARQGEIPVIKDPKILSHFLEDRAAFKDQNINAMLEPTPAVSIEATGYENDGRNMVKNAFFKVAQGQADINTALLEANDNLNQLIEKTEGK